MTLIVRAACAMVALLFASISTTSAQEWDQASRDRQAIYTALHLMDWAQTRAIAQNPDRWREVNPLLGWHPSTRDVDQYFAVTLLGHYVIANWLPENYRAIFQHLTISMEAAVTRNNIILGIKGDF